MEESAQESKTEEASKEETSTEESIKIEPKKAESPKTVTNKKPLIITAILAAILIIAAGAGIYFWQQGKVKEASRAKAVLTEKVASQSAQLAALEKDKTDLQTKVSFLEKSLKEATASANFELGELSFPTVKATHYTYDEAGESRSLLLVEATIKNETKQTLFLSTFNFKLKDAQNKSYPFAAEGSFPLPSDRVLLFDQQMAPGEIVTGTLAFAAPKSIKLFTLFYNTQQFTITAK